MRKARGLLLGALLASLGAAGLPTWAAPPRPVPAAPSPRAASKPRNERAALESFLSTSERPPSAVDLSAFGKRPDRLLISLAEDAALDPLLRARAVSALHHTPTVEARAHLAKILTRNGKSADTTDKLLLRRAAVAAGWHGGSNVTVLVGPLLDHPDPEVRVDAGVALGLSRLPDAVRLLRARVATEPDARERGHLGRQLQSLERALPLSVPPAPPPAREPPRLPPSVGGGSRSAF
jgi:HEAT repeat protein